MGNNFFVNRQQELADLNALCEKKTASIVVLYGRRRIGKICSQIKIGKGSYVTGLLEDLIKSWFIQCCYNWNFRTAKNSRIAHYRLSDNYLRFYLKNIEPNLDSNSYLPRFDISLLPTRTPSSKYPVT